MTEWDAQDTYGTCGGVLKYWHNFAGEIWMKPYLEDLNVDNNIKMDFK